MLYSLTYFFDLVSYCLTYFFKYFLWQDYVEIIVISSLIYHFLLWLKQDQQKNLANIFLAYCLITFASYFIFFPTLTYIFFTLSPIILLLFIVLHQDSLQKNFISLKKIGARPAEKSTANSNWQIGSYTEELIKCCLLALNKNKEIIFVLERSDQLDSILKAPFTCYADLNKQVFKILSDKHICEDARQGPANLFWINQECKIVAINAYFKFSIDAHLISEDVKKLQEWKQNGILVTSKTDAIIFKITPITRTFDIIIQGKLAESLNSEQFYKILKTNLDNKNFPGSEKINLKANSNSARVENQTRIEC